MPFWTLSAEGGNLMSHHKGLWTQGAVLLLVMIAISGLAPGAWAQSKNKTLYRFTGGKDGSSPASTLIFDKLRNLYGTTVDGGADNAGTVFSLSPTVAGSWTEIVLYSFTGSSDGANPDAGLIFDSAGNLYGTTQNGGSSNCQGCGVVFKLAPNSNGDWTESVLYSFLGGLDGGYPLAALVFDGSGNLYGTTESGGPGDCDVNNVHGCGVVFELTPGLNGSWTESVPYGFAGQGIDGVFPVDALIFDAAGNLYGTTSFGGTQGSGTVFSLSPHPEGWTETVLRDVDSPEDGLVFDPAGNLYGTLFYGRHRGTVFELSPATSGWTYQTLHIFTGKDGANPAASLILDHSGNIYGTTTQGGAFSDGVVFKLVPNSRGGWTEHVLWDFQGHPGAHPAAALVLDDAGNLYGTTTGDGKKTFGSVFEITP
jgi:uncharacterized repeat protein (TIGR03803 family)